MSLDPQEQERRTQKRAEIRQRYRKKTQERLERERNAKRQNYDDLFFQGTAWLNTL